MTVVDLVRLLRRNLLVLLVCTVLGVLAAAGYVFTRPTTYVATSTGIVVTANTDLANPTSGDTVASSRAGIYASLVSSVQVQRRISQNLKELGKPTAAGGEVSAASESGTPFLRVTATGVTAGNAQALANAALSGLVSEALRLETFGRTKGAELSDDKLRTMTSVNVLAYQPAALPAAPAKPNLIRNLLLGGAAGFLLGVALTVIRRAFDSKIRSQPEIEVLTSRPVLGIVPDSKELRVTKESKALVSGSAGEAMRQLRTNLRFVNVDHPPRSVVVTSPTPGDGKSTIAAHLAKLMAIAGESVVLVDCDLRRPTQGKQFGIDTSVGVTQVLTGDVDLHDALVDSSVPQLQILPAGRIPPNPSELLGSNAMRSLIERLTEHHVVIIDAPPVLAVTDGPLLGASADGVILVTRMGSTHKAQVDLCTKLLNQAQANLLGTVMNRTQPKQMGDVLYGYGGGATSYGSYKKYQSYQAYHATATEDPEVALVRSTATSTEPADEVESEQPTRRTGRRRMRRD